MKKKILSLAIVLTLFSTAFAGRPSVAAERAANSFSRKFHDASEVKWDENNRYIVASFCQRNEIYYAYYDVQGNLIGVVHHILTTALPENLQADIRKHFTDYYVSELFEVTNDEGIFYYVQLKNVDDSFLLSSEGSSGWSRYTPVQK